MSLRLIANWKLNGSKKFNYQWSKDFVDNFNFHNYSSVGIAPASIYLDHLKKVFKDSAIELGAQNIDIQESGSRTGEISASMVKDLGGRFSIIGHSERRIYFNESNSIIGQKLIQAYQSSLLPILCIGESIEQNQRKITEEVLEKQIIGALDGSVKLKSLIIAYEPIWAIGSGKIPNPEDINSLHEMIKDVVQSRFPNIDLESVLYGGSVNLENASSLFKQKNIDGALIGGASLDGKEFAFIANTFNELKE